MSDSGTKRITLVFFCLVGNTKQKKCLLCVFITAPHLSVEEKIVQKSIPI